MELADWAFRTARFQITLTIYEDHGYRYDGDDPDGETQTKLDSGEYVAFDSVVRVYMDGVEISSNSLSGSIYASNDVRSFWTAHRDSNPMNRNCSIMRAACGCSFISHYFPDMVREAIDDARRFVRRAPRLRAA